MKKILLVEDDSTVVEIYRKKFEQENYQVTVAADGLAAIRELPLHPPDLVILDLMLPKFNGADVLKFIRTNPALQHTKVVIFSNAYMTEVALAAAKIGADASLLKSSCTPAQLITIVKTLLEGGGVVEQPLPRVAPLSVAPPPEPVSAPKNIPPAKPEPAPVRPVVAAPPPAPAPTAPSPHESRRSLIQTGPEALATIRALCANLIHAPDPQSRLLHLKSLHRQMHFFAVLANLARCQRLAHLGSAIEEMLFELQERPKHIGDSTIKTLETAIQFLDELLSRANNPSDEPLTPTNLLAVLVVDDEPLSNRALVAALNRAKVKATSTADSADALHMFENHRYDLLLLDYMMPGMDGLELYRKLRALPRYYKTPVIFVTSATDFKAQHAEIIARGDDIIAKPILPIELAVKSLTLIFKSQLAAKV